MDVELLPPPARAPSRPQRTRAALLASAVSVLVAFVVGASVGARVHAAVTGRGSMPRLAATDAAPGPATDGILPTAPGTVPLEGPPAPLFYGPMTFDALPGQALNPNATTGDPAVLSGLIRHYDAHGNDFGSVQYSRAAAFNGGNARLTLAFLLTQGPGVNRDIHWHAAGDEWAYVIKGRWAAAMAAPTRINPTAEGARQGVPWESTRGEAPAGSAWFFPAGWWHTITCESPEGCAAILFFNAPPSAWPEPNSPQMAHAVHGMPPEIAAHVLGLGLEEAKAVQKDIAGPSRMDPSRPYLEVSPVTRTAACSRPGFVGLCPRPTALTPSWHFPAVAGFKDQGHTRLFPYVRGGELDCGFPGDVGATAWDLTATMGMPLLQRTARTGRAGLGGPGISGQLLELEPGGTRPPVWTLNADTAIFVAEGSVRLWIFAGDRYDGLAASDARPVDPSLTSVADLGPNSAAYVPANHLYYLQEAACSRAVLTLAFDHPEWEEIGMREGLGAFGPFEVHASLNQPEEVR